MYWARVGHGRGHGRGPAFGSMRRTSDLCSRFTSSVYGCPRSIAWIAVTKSLKLATDVAPTRTMTSPRSIPARSAGVLGKDDVNHDVDLSRFGMKTRPTTKFAKCPVTSRPSDLSVSLPWLTQGRDGRSSMVDPVATATGEFTVAPTLRSLCPRQCSARRRLQPALHTARRKLMGPQSANYIHGGARTSSMIQVQ